ncbi:DUF294 nucleotidyltransferase-like domain-containing protein [Cupriavidus sp. AU9028]|uniref:DUF294 nucleotidyltransferase-like domain-containing protein n=1 Tax=Cupriavidus sp. AU9028 TaxID=2871157 RepID=UPI001C98E17F|nr:DUF294 nucleotidyltransferase-like domain-containing protein [Cupriavidus sp. AU9028]MBY4895747.1 hypothetical protein [Cupriavidus sp. AU9028]
MLSSQVSQSRIAPPHDATFAPASPQALKAAIVGGDDARAIAIVRASPALAFAKDAGGNTALHHFARGLAPLPASQVTSRLALLDCLLTNGAELHVRDGQGLTPLQLALRSGSDPGPAMDMLMRGARADLLDEEGNNGMHCAAMHRCCADALLQLLDHHGWRGLLDVPNNRGRTPRDLALLFRQPREVVVRIDWLLTQQPMTPSGAVQGPSTSPTSPTPPDSPHASLPTSTSGPLRLRALPAPVPAPGGIAARPDWPHALEMAGRLLHDGDTDPADFERVCGHLGTVVRDWAEIDGDAEARTVHMRVLRYLTMLVDRADPGNIRTVLALLARLRSLAPRMEALHPDRMFELHMACSAFFLRHDDPGMAAGYAWHAGRISASAGTGAAQRVERALTDSEFRLCAMHLRCWATDALSLLAETLAACTSEGERASLQTLPAVLNRLCRLLTALKEASALLRCYSLPERCRAFESLFTAAAADGLGTRIKDALRQAAQRHGTGPGSPFRALADAIPPLATAMIALDLRKPALSLCHAVVLEINQAPLQPDGDRYDRAPHWALLLSRQESLPVAPGAPPVLWREFRRILENHREAIAADAGQLPSISAHDPGLRQWAVPLPIEALQSRIGEGFKTLAGRMLQTCERLMLAPAPCGFAMLGLGSMSREDMLPCSDLEYALVIEQALPADSAAARWFSGLQRLFAAMMALLGETPMPGEHGIDIQPGFRLDAAQTMASGQKELTGSPAQLAAAVVNRVRVNDQQRRYLQQAGAAGASGAALSELDQDFTFSLLAPCLLYGEGALLGAFFDALSRAAGVDGVGNIAVCQLAADVGKRRPTRRDALTFDLKEAYCGPIHHVLTALSLIADGEIPADLVPRDRMPDEPALQRLGDFVSRRRIVCGMLARLDLLGRFTPQFLADMRWALAAIHGIRLRLQLRHRKPADLVQASELDPGELAALQAIDVRVLSPLFRLLARWLEQFSFPARPPARLLSHIRKPGATEPARDGFEVQEGKRPEIASEALTDEAVTSLAVTLLHRRASTAAIVAGYCATLHRSPPQRYLPRYRIWADTMQAHPEGATVIAALAQTAAVNGWRAGWQEKESAFITGLGRWLVRNDAAQVPTLTLPAASGGSAARVGTLHPAIQSQLLASGRLKAKPQGQGGRHTVLPVRLVDETRRLHTWYVKVAPENAPMDWLVHKLDQRLSGGAGTVESAMANLSLADGAVAIQISEGVEGATLAEVLLRAPHLLGALAMPSFTRTLLRVMLTDPEDDKGSDYFVVPESPHRMVLRRIDNERAFFPAMEDQRWGAPRAKVKSQLYCLDQMMKLLDAAVLKEFRSLRPDDLLEAWLEDAQQLAQRIEPIFGVNQRSRHLERDMPSLLSVAIPYELENVLRERFTMMQETIDCAFEEDEVPTGLALFSRSHPELANLYAGAFVRFPLDEAMPGLALQRFEWLTAGSYAGKDASRSFSSLPGGQALAALHGNRAGRQDRTLHDLLTYGDHSPKVALARLRNSTMLSFNAIAAALARGDAGAPAAFRALPVSQRIFTFNLLAARLKQRPEERNLDAQTRLLGAIVGIRFVRLNLSQFAEALTDELLLPIAQGARDTLWELNLGGCTRLTQKGIVGLAESCKGLRRLYLRDLGAAASGKLSLLRKPFLSLGTLTFPALKLLDASGSTALTAIEIHAPNLERLMLRGCKALTQVETGALRLRDADIAGCPPSLRLRLSDDRGHTYSIRPITATANGPASGPQPPLPASPVPRNASADDARPEPRLLSVLQSLAGGEGQERPLTVQTLLRIWSADPERTDTMLMESMGHPDAPIRCGALIALRHAVASRSAAMGEALVPHMIDPDPAVRREALLSYARLVPLQELEWDPFANGLADTELPVRLAALETLAELAPPPPVSIRVRLLNMLVDELQPIGAGAARVLKRHDVALLRAHVEGILSRTSTPGNDAAHAARTLARLAEVVPQEALQALLQMVRRYDPDLPGEALHALARLATASPAEAARWLSKLGERRHAPARWIVIAALEALGREEPSMAVDAMRLAARGQPVELRLQAMRSIGNLGRLDPACAVRGLMEEMHGDNLVHPRLELEHMRLVLRDLGEACQQHADPALRAVNRRLEQLSSEPDGQG